MPTLKDRRSKEAGKKRGWHDFYVNPPSLLNRPGFPTIIEIGPVALEC
jgi:hypothetical protein